MDFKNIFEIISFDLVLEGIGAVFSVGLLWQLFFQQGLQQLLTLFITTLS